MQSSAQTVQTLWIALTGESPSPAIYELIDSTPTATNAGLDEKRRRRDTLLTSAEESFKSPIESESDQFARIRDCIHGAAVAVVLGFLDDPDERIPFENAALRRHYLLSRRLALSRSSASGTDSFAKCASAHRKAPQTEFTDLLADVKITGIGK